MNDKIIYREEETTKALSSIQGMLEEINEIKQNRSIFALKHFVVLSHDMPGRQRLQILDELESLFFAAMDMIDDRDMAKIDYEKTTANQEEDEWEAKKNVIRAKRYQRLMINLEMAINSRVREINSLLEMLDTMPEYTREQIEAEEAEYWRRRLSRQAFLSQRGAVTGFGEGNLDMILTLDKELGDLNEIPVMTKIDLENVLAARQAVKPQS